jgi:hypothetical protein
VHHEYNISIITINYNGLQDTCELMETLPLDDESIEVIVVDNASAQDEASVIERRFPSVKVVRSDRNLGFAGGNNLGIRASQGRYLLLINNDTFLEVRGERLEVRGERLEVRGERLEVRGERLEVRDMLKAMTERLEGDATIGAVCPKIRFADGDRAIQYAGYTPLSAITVRNRAIGFGEADQGQYDTARPTPYVHGAAMLVRREAIDKAGLMPECYFLYYEELDWSLMLRRAGYTLWYDPAMTVYHKESRTTGQASALRTYYITRNRLLFVRRNSGWTTCWLSCLYLIGIVALRDIVRHCASHRPDLAKATVKGIIHFFKTSAS